MNMLVDCSNCRTPLQLPPGARSIRCALCQAVTHIADPRTAPPPAQPPQPTAYAPPPPPAPSPYNHAPPGPPPSVHGRKKAVICGISYKFSRHELKGCLNDANLKYDARKRLRFNYNSNIFWNYVIASARSFEISVLDGLTKKEEETDPYRTPTKQNLRMALYWLVQGCQPGDSLLFHYSGHGSRQRNYNGDEVDGYDETLCPLDFETQDACHSGTVLDLPFLCRMRRNGQYVWEDHRPRSGMWKGTSGGEAISFSGCDDDQTSADTSVSYRKVD
ncbi:hypothetical protein L1049_018742 [Liquidambar formosana]|uniref:Uncharacterized protein n=1 Tax=Liquidambar formosana TaxID=63359 RepID=A0AAP0RAI0_LIQFO